MAAEIRNAADVATARHREVLVGKMQDAVAAYERERHPEAARLAKQVADEVPTVPAVRELAGLAAYRSGRWREAIRHLSAFGEMSDSVTHVPTLMDCHRALGQHKRVADLWAELRQQSPGPEVLAEARIVAAGSLADRGDLHGAIAVLATAGAAKSLRNPADRHLRQWYALGDLYERAGDLPRAREMFTRVLRVEPDAYDVADRLESLGPVRPRRKRRGTARTSGTPLPAAPGSDPAAADPDDATAGTDRAAADPEPASAATGANAADADGDADGAEGPASPGPSIADPLAAS